MSLPKQQGFFRFASMPLLAVVALAVAAIAWPSAEPSKVKASLSGSEWRVVEIDGQEASGAGTLRFTLTSIRGKAACNSFMGAFHEIGDAAIEIAGLGASRMNCEGRMELERLFLDALASARSYVLQGTTLVLMDAAGRRLVKLAG